MNEETSGDVKWVKKYDLTTKTHNNFKIVISENIDGLVSASCVYYDSGRLLKAPEQPGAGEIKHKKIVGDSLEDSYNKIYAWAVEKFGPDITVKESTQ